MIHGIPAHLQAFLATHIDSIEQLEILLLLAAHPDHRFAAEEVSDQVRTALPSALNRLTTLVEHSLVVREGECFQIRPGPELATTLRELTDAFRERRLSVVSLIYPPWRSKAAGP